MCRCRRERTDGSEVVFKHAAIACGICGVSAYFFKRCGEKTLAAVKRVVYRVKGASSRAAFKKRLFRFLFKQCRVIGGHIHAARQAFETRDDLKKRFCKLAVAACRCEAVREVRKFRVGGVKTLYHILHTGTAQRVELAPVGKTERSGQTESLKILAHHIKIKRVDGAYPSIAYGNDLTRKAPVAGVACKLCRERGSYAGTKLACGCAGKCNYEHIRDIGRIIGICQLAYYPLGERCRFTGARRGGHEERSAAHVDRCALSICKVNWHFRNYLSL